MAYNTQKKIITAIRGSPCFSMQLDTTTDVVVLTELMVSVRSIFQFEIFGDILFCETLETSTKGGEIFESLRKPAEVEKTCVSVYDWCYSSERSHHRVGRPYGNSFT
ncbi:hypothetical protein WA026_022824 [Henosepilachna vigintioctopunctata]|uniref:Uncharacterized protein n=1 Tax=Henosepilachna vigintioctopunctata TaxID=420089 RepID=A0AAW1V5R4_9CUCU